MSLMTLVTAIFLVAFAGILAGTESSLTSISRLRVEEMIADGRRGATRVRRVLADLPRYLNVVLLVRKGCELTATVLVAVLLLDRNDRQSTALAETVAIMLVVSYVVVGVGPRTLGKQRAESWVRPGALIAVVLATILGPVTQILIALGNALTPGKGFPSGPFSSEEELRDLVDQARERGLVEEEQHEMLHSVFELGDTIARELMVPRTEMVWIEKGKTLRQALSLALGSGFSRVPVTGENLDDIIGIAYIKDIAKRIHDYHDAESVEKVEQWMRPATFVPESKAADELLREMQAKQIHLAIVVDEYGGTAGLITIEDILEEIVGEIADEYDDEDAPFEWLSTNRARALARLNIEDLAAELDVEFDESDLDDVDTVGGLLAKHLGRVPIPGSEIELHGFRFVAERPIGRRRRISSVMIERIEGVQNDS
ncbi:magnesium and cobalt efflux protein CorC [mine drainage metagenome]|uniref:Magnesium and cobalt efflux protein CorC n=1 Tax=mine drainage metagenome TaxID=410659 RepID=A0A1J5Q374_9ZZZZ